MPPRQPHAAHLKGGDRSPSGLPLNCPAAVRRRAVIPFPGGPVKRTIHVHAAATIAVLCCIAGSAHAYSRHSMWDATYSPSFPVVKAYTCPNQFARFFTQPWDNILKNLLGAMNEWF